MKRQALEIVGKELLLKKGKRKKPIEEFSQLYVYSLQHTLSFTV